MVNTLRLISHAAASRKAYEAIKETSIVKTFTPDVSEVWKKISTYYDRDSAANSLDLDTIFDQLVKQFPRYEDMYEALRSRVKEYPVSTVNFLHDLQDELRAIVGMELVNAIGSRAPWEKVQALFQKADEISFNPEESTEEILNNVSVDDVLEANSEANLIKLEPKILNDFIGGGLPRPSHTLVFARPDMGKTSFMINFIKAFCKQGLKVLYFNNEDNSSKFLGRVFTVFTTQPMSVIREYPDKTQESLESNNYHMLTLVPSEAGSIAQIAKLVEQEQPDILIVDQLRNLSIDKDSRVLELETLAREMRALSRKHNVCAISVSQAGSSAENKSYLGQIDLDSSKTGVQGALDLMIGLGASEDDKNMNYRCVSFPKNKHDIHDTGPKLKFDKLTGVFS